MNTVVLLAGGMGSRMGQDIPKQFIHVNNIPVIIYTMLTLEKHPEVDAIQAVCIKGWEVVLSGYAEQFNITKLRGIVSGGATAFFIPSVVTKCHGAGGGVSRSDVGTDVGMRVWQTYEEDICQGSRTGSGDRFNFNSSGGFGLADILCKRELEEYQIDSYRRH